MSTESKVVESLLELDALIAERLMGWTVAKGGRWGARCRNKEGNLRGIRTEPTPCYSSEIAAAWEVVEQMVDRNYGKVHVSGSHYHGWHAWVAWDDDGEHGSSVSTTEPICAVTAPLAICLAALRADGLEVEVSPSPLPDTERGGER